MSKERRGNALPIELLPRLVEQIGFEPMTDNPMSSAHQNESGKKATVELRGVLRVAPPPQATDRIYTGIAGFTRPHNRRPAEFKALCLLENAPAKHQQKLNRLCGKTFPREKIRAARPARPQSQ